MNRNSYRIIDAACRVLRDYSDGSFPISPFKIARNMGVRVVDKADVQDLLDYVLPDGEGIKSPAFVFSCGGQWYIVLDRNRGDALDLRAWVAHELGHIVLADTFGESSWKVQRMVRDTFRRSLVDLSCDLFAVNLLAPQAVLAMGGVQSAVEITRICRVHPFMACLAAGAIRLPRDGYSAAEIKAWETMADGLRERVQQVRSPFGQAPEWFSSDISAELTF